MSVLPPRESARSPLALLEYELRDDDALILVRANAAAESMLGIAEAVSLGRSIEDLFPAFPQTGLPALYRQIARDGGSIEREQVHYVDARISGDYEIVALQSAPRRVTVLFTDVTATRRIERERDLGRALFGRVFEMMPEPLALTRHGSGAYLDVNRAWVEVFGIAREDAIGRHGAELGLWIDPEERRALRKRLSEERHLREVEVAFRRRGGLAFPALLSASLIDDAEGEISIWLARDLGPQRRLAAQLAATLEHTPGVAIQWYDRHGKVLLWNAASETLYRIRRDEAIGRTIGELIYTAEQTADFLRLLAAVQATGQPHGPVEIAVRLQDGATVELLYTVFMIPGDGDEPVFVCMDIDLSQQRRAEAERRAGEARARTLADRLSITAAATGIGFWEFDYARGELRSDEQHKRLHGLAPDFSGNLYDAIRAGAAPGDDERLRAIAARAAAGVEPYSSGEFEIRWPDGSQHWLLMRGQVARDAAGKPVSHTGVTVDITASKRAEMELRELAATLEARVAERSAELERATRELMQSEKLAALGRLVAGVAHELNTPIGNSLLVATGLADATRSLDAALAAGLRRSELDAFLDQARRSSALLKRNLERAADLIVSFKQVAVDQASAQRRRFALDELVDEITTTFAPSLRGRSVSIDAQVSAGLEMDSYPGALGQVLTNLIANAVNHGFDDGRTGRVLISGRATGDGVVLRVSDDGRGMAADELTRIFEPFYTSKLGQGGSGLGLPIVRSLVDDVLGGRISVESEPGRGTSFIVLLPRSAPQAAPR